MITTVAKIKNGNIFGIKMRIAVSLLAKLELQHIYKQNYNPNISVTKIRIATSS